MRDPAFKEWWEMSERQYQRWSFATDAYTHTLTHAHSQARVRTHIHTLTDMGTTVFQSSVFVVKAA